MTGGPSLARGGGGDGGGQGGGRRPGGNKGVRACSSGGHDKRAASARAGPHTPATAVHRVAAGRDAPRGASAGIGNRNVRRRLPPSRRRSVGAGLGNPTEGHKNEEHEKVLGSTHGPTTPVRERPSAAPAPTLAVPMSSIASDVARGSTCIDSVPRVHVGHVFIIVLKAGSPRPTPPARPRPWRQSPPPRPAHVDLVPCPKFPASVAPARALPP